MTQFSTLYTALLDQELGTDDSTVLFTTARRKAAVNDGQEEFVELTECLVRVSSVTMTGDGATFEYDLNSTANIPGGDFNRLVTQPVEYQYTDASSYTSYVTGDELLRRDVEWLNRYEPQWRDSTGSSLGQQLPRVYYLRAAGPSLFLGFYPCPSTGSSASAKAIVPYLARPAAMSDDTSEPFTVNSSVRLDLRPYHVALVHYAAHQLEKLRRDEAASDRQLQKFLAYVQRFLQTQRRRGGQVITQGRSYFRRVGTLTERPKDPRT